MSTKTKSANALCVRDFRKAWNAVRPMIPNKATLPITGCLHIKCSGETIWITADTLEHRLTLKVDGSGDGGKWEAVVEKATLTDAMKGKPAGTTITFSKESISFGNGMSYPIGGWDPGEFPACRAQVKKSCQPVQFPVSEVVRALRYASTDETRYIMCGVYVNNTRGEIAATDGKRLIFLPIEVGNPDMPNVILPSDSATVLKRVQDYLPDVVTMSLENGRYGVIETPTLRYQVKVVEGNYPNYPQVVPDLKKRPNFWMLGDEKEELIKWLSSAKADETTLTSIKDGTVTVELVKGEAQVIGKKVYPDSGYGKLHGDHAIWLATPLLLGAIEDADTLHFGDEMDCVVGTQSGFPVAVIMPMRRK
jgi:DNA polymerase III sliding clamp (beta) subunit (PCNA family)